MKKEKRQKSINENSNTFQSLLSQISTDQISSIGKSNYADNIKKNISTEINSNGNNNIKRINKRVITFNKKKKNNNKENHKNANISKNRYISSIPIKKLNKNNNRNIIINNNLNIYDIKNISHQYLTNPLDYINYDFNKYLNKVNLTNINLTESNEKEHKNNLIEKKPKISIDSKINHIPYRYSSNNIKINKKTKKHSTTTENSGVGGDGDDTHKKRGHKQNNSFNFINPLSNTKKNTSILQNAKKINVRSNSYRMSGHEKNYIKKKRELNYRYDLTEPEGNISPHFLKNKNSKLSNLSLFSNGLDFLGISTITTTTSNNNNTNNFLQNIKTNELNNHFANINKGNKLSGRYYLNIQNVGKCPQIFNNYYSINGVSSSNFPIKVINVFNNK